jgi:predicted metal-dependent enzyme (double-stranded beta helix superfamily)
MYMDRTNQMARELESMLTAGEIDTDIMDEIQSMVDDLKKGKKTLNEFYSASTPHKLLNILDVVNQRVKR